MVFTLTNPVRNIYVVLSPVGGVALCGGCGYDWLTLKCENVGIRSIKAYQTI